MNQTMTNVKEDFKVDPEYEARTASAMSDAFARGDRKTARTLMKKLHFTPAALMMLKDVCGADYIRALDLNTIRADLEFGPDWLEGGPKPIAELAFGPGWFNYER